MAGYPFPIPKTGSEAIWNHLLRYNGLGYDNTRYDNWNVDAAGVPTLAVTADANWAWPIYDPKKTGPINAGDPYWANLKADLEPQIPTISKVSGAAVMCLHISPEGKIVDTKFDAPSHDDILDDAVQRAVKLTQKARNDKPPPVPTTQLGVIKRWVCFRFHPNP